MQPAAPPEVPVRRRAWVAWLPAQARARESLREGALVRPVDRFALEPC